MDMDSSLLSARLRDDERRSFWDPRGGYLDQRYMRKKTNKERKDKLERRKEESKKEKEEGKAKEERRERVPPNVDAIGRGDGKSHLFIHIDRFWRRFEHRHLVVLHFCQFDDLLCHSGAEALLAVLWEDGDVVNTRNIVTSKEPTRSCDRDAV